MCQQSFGRLFLLCATSVFSVSLWWEVHFSCSNPPLRHREHRGCTEFQNSPTGFLKGPLMSDPILQTEELTKRYGRRIAVERIDKGRVLYQGAIGELLAREKLMKITFDPLRMLMRQSIFRHKSVCLPNSPKGIILFPIKLYTSCH
jgi:hypothetical protein